MSDMRAHILLTADGRSVVLTSRQAQAALSGVKTETLGAGEAAARADLQQQSHAKALAAGRRAALMLTAALGGLAAGFSANALKDASFTMDGIESALTQATGSAALAKAEFSFLDKEAERLGVGLAGAADSYGRLAVAAKGSTIEGQGVREIFLGVSEAGVVLNRSQSDVQGALTAIEQMMSKGKVSAEELRGQLGERLPGALKTAERALGVTSEELSKMLENGEILAEDFLPKFAAQLRREFSDSLPAAMGKPARELERLKNDLFKFQVDVAGGGFMDGLIEGTEGLREVLANPEFREDARALFKAIGEGAGLSANALVFLTQNTALLKAGVAGLVGVKLAGWLTAAKAGINLKTNALRASNVAAKAAAQNEIDAAFDLQQRARQELVTTQAMARRTTGTTAQIAANIKVIQSENAVAAATVRITAAQNAATASSLRLAAAKRGLSAATAFLGGPLGVALVAVTGLTAAIRLYGEATAAKLEDSAAELALIEELDAASQGLAEISRDNASAKLLEAEAIREKVTAQRDELAAAREAVGQRMAPFMGAEMRKAMGASMAGPLGNLIEMAGAAEAEFENLVATVRLTQQEAAALDLLGDPSLEASAGGGYLIALGKVKDALMAAGEETDEWAGRVKAAEGNVEAIRSRIEAWGRADDARVTVQLTKGEQALAQYRAQLELATQNAGRTKEAAKIEEIALQLVNKAKAASIELSLEEARIEAAGHVQKRSFFEAQSNWLTLDKQLQERRKAAFETPEETARRKQALELYTASQAAGVAVTLKEITARLKNIDALEAEEKARAEADRAQAAANDNYEYWLEQRELDLKLSALNREEREIELLMLDRINLAAKAGIEISEAQARRWAQNHVARLDQLERERVMIRDVYDAYDKAAEDIEDLWTGTWEDIWAGNFDTIDDFAGDVGDIFERLAKQIAAQMIIKPILDQSGLGAALGIPGLGGNSGGTGGLLGGTSGGLGTALFGKEGIAGLFGGKAGGLLGTANGALAALPGIGGILSSGSAAISGALGALPGIGAALGPLAASLGPVGLVAGAVFGLTQILKKKPPRLKSYFGTTASGDIGITSSETRRTDAGMTNEIASSINEIMDRLGVTLSSAQNFTVLYKPEKDYLDVNFNDGRHFQGGKDDAGEAIAFAVSELLKGPVEGLNAAVQAQIRAAGRITDVSQLDEILGQFEQAQSFGQAIEDAINQRENPQRLELDNLERAQEARRAELDRFRELGYVTDDVIQQLNRLEQIELDEVLTRLGETAISAGDALSTVASDARVGIQKWLEDLNISNDNTPLSVQDRRANAQTAFDAQLALAQAGDADALSNITDYAEQLLALDREATSSAADRAALYDSIVASLEGLAEPPVIDPMAGVIEGLEQVEGRLADLPGQITPPITAGLSEIQTELPAGFGLLNGQLIDLRDLNSSEFGLMRGSFTNDFTAYGDVFEDRIAGLRGSVEAQGPWLSPLASRLGNLEALMPAGHDGIISRLGDVYGRQDVIRGINASYLPEFAEMRSRLGNINQNTVGGHANVVSRMSDVWSRIGEVNNSLGVQLPEFIEMRNRLGNINANTVNGHNGVVSGISSLRTGTLAELGNLNTAVSQDLNDNFVSALNDNIGLMRGDLLQLRDVTSNVDLRISDGTQAQLEALYEIIVLNEARNRHFEQ